MFDPVKSEIISSEEVREYGDAQYCLTTIIPLVENPKRNTYIVDQETLDNFLEGYNEYAEFIISVEKLYCDNNLPL